MTVSGQFSCPPAGSFVAVSGQFLVAADILSRYLDFESAALAERVIGSA